MNKGLEALEKVKSILIDYGNFIKSKKPNTFVECRGNVEKYVEINYICDIEKELKEGEKNKQVLEIISQNFRLVGNCLIAKNKYAETGWVFVKEIEDEEESKAWKEVLL